MNYPLLPKQMPDRIKSVWKKSNIVTTGIFLIIGVLATALLNWFEVLEGVWLWTIGIYFSVILVWFIIAMILIPYRYQYHRYEITPEDLSFQEGYIFRTITHVPINRIQHIETEQGPFLRKEKLMEMVIHTAASSHHISGLDIEEAVNLRQQIIELVKVAKEDV
ncbi:PH domain-containing protein [Desemzia sp. RIT804]|uniref:PH domain-containing protein n=1 Tax=Desemzia sp. RIT 804 TaxID=2810209 RepID=UPI00194DFCD4|nr:PH domain-containing protein [Desemzia sp. RIT 804]MBM6614852.1 PH domain-containing protein [Desemzia sp. RIT 804]